MITRSCVRKVRRGPNISPFAEFMRLLVIREMVASLQVLKNFLLRVVPSVTRELFYMTVVSKI